MKELFTLIAGMLLCLSVTGQNSQPDSSLWGTNGVVNAMEKDIANNVVYLGGAFTQVRKRCNYFASIDPVTAVADNSTINPNGVVYAMVSDGTGGWFLGGTFTAIGTQTRNRLAHVNAAGQLTPWDPNADGSVFSLAISGNILYVGGGFTSIGGVSRNRIAAFDITTGLATLWDPNAGGSVTAIYADGTTVYVGGPFTSIAGQTRNRLAALDSATGVLTSWNPNVSSTVNTIVKTGNNVYIGGNFTTIGGQPKNRLAAIDAITGSVTSWSPVVNNQVRSLAVGGGVVYVGGNFTSPASRLAAFDAVTGLVAPFTAGYISGPSLGWGTAPVKSLLLSNGILYVGCGGLMATASALRAFDASSGVMNTWNPGLVTGGDGITALASSGNKVFAVGDFNYINAVSRNNIAALNGTTYEPISWNPGISGGVPGWGVASMKLNGSTLYVGGSFTTVGAMTRNNIAAIDALTGVATTWDPSADGDVKTIEYEGGTIYAGGGFTSIGGQNRNRIAAIDASTGLATSWDPDASSWVNCIAVHNNSVYAGGNFITIGGQFRNRLAAIDKTTGLATSWDPNADNVVSTLAVDGSTLYVGGSFTNFGVVPNLQPRGLIAAFDLMTGSISTWNPNITGGQVNKIIRVGNIVYAGGDFATLGGQPNNDLAAIDASTGLSTGWNSGTDYVVNAMFLDGTKLYVGGNFFTIGGTFRDYFAVFSTINPLSTAFTKLLARRTGGSIEIFWTMENADEVNFFEVERSEDGKTFEKLATVAATAINNYGVTDNSPYSGDNYFRIKAVSEKGHIVYSKVVRVSMSGPLTAVMNVYPNPVIGDEFQLQLNNFNKGEYTVVLYTLYGQPVKQYSFNYDGGSSNLSFHINGISHGMYLLKLEDHDKRMVGQGRLVK